MTRGEESRAGRRSTERLHKRYLYRDLSIDTLHSRSIGFTWDLNGRVPPSALAFSLLSYPVQALDWGQTLGFHTIYNAALSNGIEYESGRNEHEAEETTAVCAFEAAAGPKCWRALTSKLDSDRPEPLMY